VENAMTTRYNGCTMNQEREHYCEPTPPYNPRYRLVDMGETHALFPLVDDRHDETTAFPTTRFALIGAPAIHIVAFKRASNRSPRTK
jgi:hypothetical protein